jgi:hypothetical protein
VVASVRPRFIARPPSRARGARVGLAAGDELEERRLDVVGSGEREHAVDRVVGKQLAVAHEQQAVASLRLVHHVARHEERRACGGELVEELPELHAQHRVEPHGGLVEHQHLGPAEERRRKRHAPALPARERPGEALLEGPHLGALDRLVDVGCRGAEHPGEVPDVLPDREVVVHARLLGHVGHARAQVARPGGSSEHLDRARVDDLHADDRSHQRRLAAPARAEQADDAAARDREGEAVQHRRAHASHMQVVDDDRRRRGIRMGHHGRSPSGADSPSLRPVRRGRLARSPVGTLSESPSGG